MHPIATALKPLAQAYRRNPYPTYAVLRRVAPVVRVPRLNLWLVSRYDDVKRVLSEHASFSSDFRGMEHPEQLGVGRQASLIASDPPVHSRLRALVTRAFTARAVANLEPRIEEITTDLLDRVAHAGSMDLVADLAYPLPVVVIAELLGVPVEDRARFKKWSDELIAWSDHAVLEPGGADAVNEMQLPPPLQAEMGPYFADIIARRRAEPREDLISGLVRAEVEGEQLSDADVLAFCWLLLIAGNVTTTNLIGNAVRTFIEHPEHLDRLQRDPALLPTAIEEVLRYRSPVQFMFRVAREGTVLAGRSIPAGSRVIALIGSANRDEAQFPGANVFDPARDPNPHMAFGFGVHYCLGAPLARLEARVALRAMLTRFSDLRAVQGIQTEPAAGLILLGQRELPLRFRPVPTSFAVSST